MKRQYLHSILALAVFLSLPFGGLSYGADRLPSGFSLQDLQSFISGAEGGLHHALALEEKPDSLPPEMEIVQVKYLLEFFLACTPKTADWTHETSHAENALSLIYQALGHIRGDNPQEAWPLLKQAHLHVRALQGTLGVRFLNR